MRVARWDLNLVAGYASRGAPAAVAAELEGLRATHAELLPSAQDAWVEVFELLERHGATAAFEEWRGDRSRVVAGYWLTGDSLRVRLRGR
jgi:hypothetical protein